MKNKITISFLAAIVISISGCGNSSDRSGVDVVREAPTAIADKLPQKNSKDKSEDVQVLFEDLKAFDTKTVYLNQDFNPENIVVRDKDGNDISSEVIVKSVSGNVDSKTPGTYSVEIKYEFGGEEFIVVKKIIVKENTPPEISLIGQERKTVFVSENYSDLGATAFDQEDGNLTSIITASVTKLN